MKISVILLAKNEEGNIEQVVEEAKKVADEVICIDGNSTDNTALLAEKSGAIVYKDSGKGKGDGVRLGLQKATGDILVLADADGSHNLKDVPKLVEPIKKGIADVVIGSRLLGGSDELHGSFSNYIRMVGAGFITLLVNLRFKTNLTDILNGFRAIKKSIVPSLNLKANGFDIEQELITSALKKGYKVTEVPSHEFKRKSGKSKLPTYKGLKFLIRLIKDLFF